MATPAEIVAKARSQIGVHEQPDGSNDGPQVHAYQSATGAYRAPWCISLIQWVLVQVGIGTIANRTASAYYLGDYARSHGWTVPDPEPADIVIYRIGQGHGGIVEKVVDKDHFVAIEGNESNGVNAVPRDRSLVYCFIRVPGVKPKPKTRLLPRFEVVSSEGGHAVVRAVWGKWSKVGPQIPRLAKRYRDVRVRRKTVKAAR